MKTLTLILLLFFLKSSKGQWNLEEYPTLQSENCGNVESLWLCDPDQIISSQLLTSISQVLHQIHQVPTGCSEGVKLGVALMKEFNLMGKVPEKQAKEMASGLRKEWKLDVGSCNCGILFLLSVNNRQVFISTGSTIKYTLTDELIHKIIDQMKPGLRDGKYSEMILQSLESIRDLLKQGIIQKDKKKEKMDTQFSLLDYILFQFIEAFNPVYIVMFMMAFFLSLALFSSTPTPREIIRILEIQHKKEIDNTNCPACFTKFKPNQPENTTKFECGHRFCKKCVKSDSVCMICSTSDQIDAELKFRVNSFKRLHPGLINYDLFFETIEKQEYKFTQIFDEEMKRISEMTKLRKSETISTNEDNSQVYDNDWGGNDGGGDIDSYSADSYSDSGGDGDSW